MGCGEARWSKSANIGEFEIQDLHSGRDTRPLDLDIDTGHRTQDTDVNTNIDKDTDSQKLTHKQDLHPRKGHSGKLTLKKNSPGLGIFLRAKL